MESSKLVFVLSKESQQLGQRLGGMTIDCKFKLWVALTGSGCLLRIDPWSGQEIMRLEIGTAILLPFDSSSFEIIIFLSSFI